MENGCKPVNQATYNDIKYFTRNLTGLEINRIPYSTQAWAAVCQFGEMNEPVPRASTRFGALVSQIMSMFSTGLTIETCYGLTPKEYERFKSLAAIRLKQKDLARLIIHLTPGNQHMQQSTAHTRRKCAQRISAK